MLFVCESFTFTIFDGDFILINLLRNKILPKVEE